MVGVILFDSTYVLQKSKNVYEFAAPAIHARRTREKFFSAASIPNILPSLPLVSGA